MQRFEIRVPGSIANLGPGFDTLAVAVELYLTLNVTVLAGENRLEFDFGGCAIEGENYIERAFRFLAGQRGGSHPSLHVEVSTEIPLKGGLGSSAAATVAGLRLYETVTGPLSTQGLLNAACALEGHPDNASAALLGGLTISCQLPDRSVFALRLEWPEEISLLVLTPKLSLSTSASRRVLPESIPLEDAVFNLQRVALFLEAIRGGEHSLLRQALQDRLHQPYRCSLVPGLADLLGLEHPDLLGVCLSGAGPSIVAFAKHNLDGVEASLREAFTPYGIPFAIRRLAAHTVAAGDAVATLPSSHS